MKSLDKNHIFSLLDSINIKQQKIVVGVSWWPDSMLLATLIKEYFSLKWLLQSDICVAHFNHWQRKESKKELSFIQKHFDYNTVYRNTNIPKKWLWETKLRDLRHTFFEEVIHKTKASYLFLWHNLSDRIETSLLHIVRWSSIDWILSIKQFQNKKKYTIVRPLLDITKPNIQAYCDTSKIPYFIDQTNNVDGTPRNILRNTSIPLIQSLHAWWIKNRYTSWLSLYKHLENTNSPTIQRLTHQPHTLWWATKRYSLPIKDITSPHLFLLFKDTYYATQKTITAIQSFLKTWSGHMYVWWWYLFIVWWELHCVNWSKDFWKQKHTQQKKITQHWKQEYNWYTFNAPKERIWKKLRYPIEGDVYKKKRLLKYMLNKKIPVFMRNTTLVVVSDNKVISILN